MVILTEDSGFRTPFSCELQEVFFPPVTAPFLVVRRDSAVCCPPAYPDGTDHMPCSLVKQYLTQRNFN